MQLPHRLYSWLFAGTVCGKGSAPEGQGRGQSKLQESPGEHDTTHEEADEERPHTGGFPRPLRAAT
jgi:hypothetical protein